MSNNNLLEQFALAIKKFEGWFGPCIKFPKGTISYQNNNPGNLRWSRFQTGKNQGFAVFKTYNDGWKALIWDITLKAQGKTRTSLGPSSTLYDFFSVWAPGSDGNKPRQYAENVAKHIGISPNTTLREIYEPKKDIEPIRNLDDLEKENLELKRHINDLELEFSECQSKLDHYKKAFQIERNNVDKKPDYTIPEILTMLLKAILRRKEQ